MADSKKSSTPVVLAPLVAVKTENGGRVYQYRGAQLGDGFDKEDVKRLVDLGLAGEDDGSAVPGVGA